MPFHVFEHISFLSVRPSTNLTRVRSYANMHTSMIKDAPSASELLFTILISTDIVSCNSSLFILSLLNFTVVVFQQFHVHLTLC